MANHWLKKKNRYKVERWHSTSSTWLLYGAFEDLTEAIIWCHRGHHITNIEHRVFDADTENERTIYLVRADGSVLDLL